MPWNGYYIISRRDNLALILPAYAGVPNLMGLTPNQADAGGPGLTLTVTGNNFESGAIVNWNGTARPTTYTSSTQLMASVTDADIARAGSVPITVVNPGPLGGVSLPLPFTVIPSQSVPQITGLSPAEATTGTRFALTITGNGFVQGSIVTFSFQGNPVTLVPTAVMPKQIVLTIDASMIGKAGAYTTAVINPQPGGTSNLQSLNVGMPLIVVSLAGSITRTSTEILVPIFIKNGGTGSASSVTVTLGKLNSAAATSANSLPLSVGPLAAGASSLVMTLRFPASAVLSSSHTGQLTIGGKYLGVTSPAALGYTTVLRVALP